MNTSKVAWYIYYDLNLLIIYVFRKISPHLSFYEYVFCLYFFLIAKIYSSTLAKMNICDILSNLRFTKISTCKNLTFSIQLNNVWNKQISWSQNSCLGTSKAFIKSAIASCGCEQKICCVKTIKLFAPISPHLREYLWAFMSGFFVSSILVLFCQDLF